MVETTRSSRWRRRNQQTTGDDAACTGAGYAGDIPARGAHDEVTIAIAGKVAFHQERATEGVVSGRTAHQRSEVAGVLPRSGDDVFVHIDAATAAVGIGSTNHEVGPAVAVEVARSERPTQTAEFHGAFDASVGGLPRHATLGQGVVVKQIDRAELLACLGRPNARADGNHGVPVQYQSTAAKAGTRGTHHEGFGIGIRRTGPRTQGVQCNASGTHAFGRVARSTHDQLCGMFARCRQGQKGTTTEAESLSVALNGVATATQGIVVRGAWHFRLGRGGLVGQLRAPTPLWKNDSHVAAGKCRRNDGEYERFSEAVHQWLRARTGMLEELPRVDVHAKSLTHGQRRCSHFFWWNVGNEGTRTFTSREVVAEGRAEAGDLCSTAGGGTREVFGRRTHGDRRIRTLGEQDHSKCREFCVDGRVWMERQALLNGGENTLGRAACDAESLCAAEKAHRACGPAGGGLPGRDRSLWAVDAVDCDFASTHADGGSQRTPVDGEHRTHHADLCFVGGDLHIESGAGLYRDLDRARRPGEAWCLFGAGEHTGTLCGQRDTGTGLEGLLPGGIERRRDGDGRRLGDRGHDQCCGGQPGGWGQQGQPA